MSAGYRQTNGERSFAATNFRVGGGSDRVADEVERQITELLDSFRLLSVADPVAEARKDRERADQDFGNFASTAGREMFAAQLRIALERLRGMDLNGKAGIERAISLLRPFRSYAGMLPQGERTTLAKLWTAMDQAEENPAGRPVSAPIRVR